MTDLAPPQQPYKRRFRLFRSVSALILREMATTYGRSPGGYVWAILEPVAGIALLSVVFALIMRSPALGSNFPLFFATGLLPFQIYMMVSSQTAAAIRFSKPLLSYPAMTFLDALLARFILGVLTHMLVMVVVLYGIVQIYDLKLILDWGAICNALAMAVAFAFAVGVANCYLTSNYPLWERIWAILNRPMFILSGILFIPEIVPVRFRDWFMLNPLANITSEMRRGFYSTYDAVYVNATYVYIVSTIVTIFGLLFLLRYYKDIMLK